MSAAIPNVSPPAPYPVQLTVDLPPDARNRLTYAVLLVPDVYPPFRLGA